ncbi:MAG: hypothetical protein JNK00_05055 [Flavipsychrobacter sp.]|nr:hypothetical protein [Flavipsychrobacter sp.]
MRFNLSCTLMLLCSSLVACNEVTYTLPPPPPPKAPHTVQYSFINYNNTPVYLKVYENEADYNRMRNPVMDTTIAANATTVRKFITTSDLMYYHWYTDSFKQCNWGIAYSVSQVMRKSNGTLWMRNAFYDGLLYKTSNPDSFLVPLHADVYYLNTRARGALMNGNDTMTRWAAIDIRTNKDVSVWNNYDPNIRYLELELHHDMLVNKYTKDANGNMIVSHTEFLLMPQSYSKIITFLLFDKKGEGAFKYCHLQSNFSQPAATYNKDTMMLRHTDQEYTVLVKKP